MNEFRKATATASTVPAGVNAILDARRYIQGAYVESTARAIYIEDNWSVTPNLLLSLGLRFDSFESKVGGSLFTKAGFGDMMAPRLGFSWDMKGDGTTKLFGNAGRYYLPMTHVRMDFLKPSESVSHCPYKGEAEWWSLRVGDEIRPDVAWSYPTPLPESQKIAGLISFYPEKVDVYVDGVLQA